MFDKNAAELVGTIAEEPKFKKTENTGRSKIAFALKIHRTPNTFDRIYVTAWEEIADEIHDHYHKDDRIGVQGRIRISSYHEGEGTRFFTRVVAEKVYTPDQEEKTEDFGVIHFEADSRPAAVK